MKRRGDISLEYLMGLVIVVFILLTLITFYDDLKLAIQKTFGKEESPTFKDVERVVAEMKTLSRTETLKVYANSFDYDIALYSSKDAPEDCKEYSCICIKEKDKFPKCTPLTEMPKDCTEQSLCISESSTFQVKLEGQGRAFIPLCSKENSVLIGEACG